MEKVIIEIIVASQLSGAPLLDHVGNSLPGVTLDQGYEPVPMEPSDTDASLIEPGQKVVVLRGSLDPAQREALESDPRVLHVWSDGEVQPFSP